MGRYSDDYRSEEEEKRQQIFIPTERPIVGKSCWGVVIVKGNVDFLLLQPNTVKDQLENLRSCIVHGHIHSPHS